MSITSLSNKDGSRPCWAFIFEFYFGMTIKYFIPIMMQYMWFKNLKSDLKDPIGGHSPVL
jgi:hypothetical protein